MSELKVFCRFRPQKVPNKKRNNEDGNGIYQLATINDNAISLFNGQSLEKHLFEFDHVLDQSCTQVHLFEQIGRQLVNNLIEGSNALLFAYGVTSSGKSFTINGNVQMPGLIPRSLAYLFKQLSNQINPAGLIFYNNHSFQFNNNEEKEFNDEWHSSNEIDLEQTFCIARFHWKKISHPISEWARLAIPDNEISSADTNNNNSKHLRRHYTIFISFLEVYNNTIFDLLQFQDKNNIAFTRTPRNILNNSEMICVHNAREIEVSNFKEAIQIFAYGLQNRRICQTELNSTSSRSHTIFTIKLVHLNKKFKAKVNQYSIVDLAGIERAKRTNNFGTKLMEASNINHSLMVLRNCFDAVQKNILNPNRPILVPYRESKLTNLLKPYFEYRSKIQMILCIKPDIEDINENRIALSFAKKTQKIDLQKFRNFDGKEKSDEMDNDLNYQSINSLKCKPIEQNFDPETVQEFIHSLKNSLDNLFLQMKNNLQILGANLKSIPDVRLKPKFNFQSKLTTFGDDNKLSSLVVKLSDILNSYTESNIVGMPCVIMNENYINEAKILIEEIGHQVDHYNNCCIDVENQFMAHLNYCSKAFRMKYEQKLKSMDVFARLYYQSPARYKQNRMENCSKRSTIKIRSTGFVKKNNDPISKLNTPNRKMVFGKNITHSNSSKKMNKIQVRYPNSKLIQALCINYDPSMKQLNLIHKSGHETPLTINNDSNRNIQRNLFK